MVHIGIMYYGRTHYAWRVVDKNGQAWTRHLCLCRGESMWVIKDVSMDKGRTPLLMVPVCG